MGGDNYDVSCILPHLSADDTDGLLQSQAQMGAGGRGNMGGGDDFVSLVPPNICILLIPC